MGLGRFLNDSWWVAWRELKHFAGQKIRIFFVIVQPLIWLALMGNMFQRVAQVPGFPAGSYLNYMAPGIVVMTTLFGGIFGGMSLVWDRRFGFLQKMLGAPISRGSIVVGKMIAIGLQTALQAFIIFLIALAFGVKFAAGAGGLFFLLLLAVLLSLVFAGISLSLATVIGSQETLMVVINFLTMPLMFTSNALMPLSFMPNWLATLAKYNPLSYAINPMRSLFLSGFDWTAIRQGVALLGAIAIVMAAIPTRLFRRSLG